VLVIGLKNEEYRIFMGKLEGKRSFGRSRHGFVKNIKM
jgi:hypothetical protein